METKEYIDLLKKRAKEKKSNNTDNTNIVDKIINRGKYTDTSTSTPDILPKKQYKFNDALGIDLKTFFSNIYKIPQALWHTTKQGIASTGSYNLDKPMWNQAPDNWRDETKELGYMGMWKKYSLPNVKAGALMATPGYNLLDIVSHAPYVAETKFGKALPQTGGSDIMNKMFLDSMAKGTGKFVYDPESKGRKWFPKVSEGTRYQDYKERPFSTAFEDITNVSIVLAPIFKALGLGGKIAATPMAKFIANSKVGQGVAHSTALVKKGTQYIPNKIVQKIGQKVANFKLEQEFKQMMSDFNRNTFSGKERILNPTNKRLVELGKALPVEAQSYLFDILEGTALYKDKVLTTIYGGAKSGLKAIGESGGFNAFKSNFDTALDYIRKKSLHETNYLVKKGVITAEQATKRAWIPAVKQYLIRSGRYTTQELDDILKEGGGFAKTIGDEFDIATAEFDKYITQLEGAGYKKPVYMPHQFIDEYPNTSINYKQQPIYKKTPSYLKTTKGVSGYSKEPYVVWTRHELERLKTDMTARLVDKVVKKFGLPLSKSEKLATGYKPYYPEGVIKDILSKYKVNTKVQLPSMIADEMSRVFGSTTNFEKFLKVTFDPITKAWKTSVLALSPRWLFNNFMGNMALNTVAGVVDPMAYIKSFKKMKQASKIIKEEGGSYNRAMAQVGVRSGVAEGGLMAAEGRSALAGFANAAETSPIQNMFGKVFNYTGLPQIAKGMYKVNKSIENFYRIAHYIDKLDKGLTPSKALKSVNEFLFDYSALSTVEKRVVRRMVPFYAWQKNITRLIFSMPVKHPASTAAIGKLINIVPESEMTEDIRDGYLDKYLSDYIETDLKSTSGENLYLSTRGMNPFADVGMATGNWQNYLGSIHPAMKMALENLTGQSAHKGTPFSSPDRAFGSNEKIVPSFGRQLMSNIQQAKLIEDLLFPYSKYDTGEPILDKDGNAKYPKDRWLSILKLFGISLTPYDLESMKEQNIKEMKAKQTAMSKQDVKESKFDKWESIKELFGID